jgi:hypothetical protein
MMCKLLTNDRWKLLFKLMKAQLTQHQIVNLNTELLHVPLIVRPLTKNMHSYCDIQKCIQSAKTSSSPKTGYHRNRWSETIKQRRVNKRAYLRQIIFSWLYFLAKAINEGSMIPPRSRNTKCKVDSAGIPAQPCISTTWNSTRSYCKSLEAPLRQRTGLWFIRASSNST